MPGGRSWARLRKWKLLVPRVTDPARKGKHYPLSGETKCAVLARAARSRAALRHSVAFDAVMPSETPMTDQGTWHIRCLTCGQSRDAAAAGIYRVGAVGRKYTVGWCSRCRWLRCCVVERSPRWGFEVIRP